METLFKIGVVTITLCLAFFFVRLLVRTVKEDNAEKSSADQVEDMNVNAVTQSEMTVEYGASATVSINKVEHDIQTKDGESGMRVTATISVDGLKGKSLTTKTKYYYRDGSVAYSPKNVKPIEHTTVASIPYESCTINHEEIVTYSELPQKAGEQTRLFFVISIICDNTVIAKSDPWYFFIQ